MSNIVQVARDRDEIMASTVYCPVCGEMQYSPFDKLYVEAFSRCVEDTPAKELEGNGDQIFQILAT